MGRIARRLGVELPVFCERHGKVAFNDVLGAIPRSAPLTIWCDPVRLPWSDEERSELADSEHRRLLEEFPAGVHGRSGGRGREPVGAADLDLRRRPGHAHVPRRVRSELREITIRGMSRMVPALAGYLSRLPRAFVDGGYYTKTRENRLLPDRCRSRAPT